MTLLEVELEAAKFGFRLRRVESDTQGSAWQWQRGSDQAGPRFLTERESFAWMADQLHEQAFGPQATNP